MTVPSYRYLGEALGFERVDWPWSVVKEPLPFDEPWSSPDGSMPRSRPIQYQIWHAHAVRGNRSESIIWLFLREGVEPTEELLRRFETAVYSGRLTPRREHVPDPPKAIEWSLTRRAGAV